MKTEAQLIFEQYLKKIVENSETTDSSQNVHFTTDIVANAYNVIKQTEVKSGIGAAKAKLHEFVDQLTPEQMDEIITALALSSGNQGAWRELPGDKDYDAKGDDRFDAAFEELDNHIQKIADLHDDSPARYLWDVIKDELTGEFLRSVRNEFGNGMDIDMDDPDI